MNPQEVRKLCVESLKHAQVGTAEQELQNGVGLYKHQEQKRLENSCGSAVLVMIVTHEKLNESMFEHYPHYRKYFKGKEGYKGDEVQADDFFKAQGQRLLLAVHVLGSTYDVPETFKAYTREVLNMHKRGNIMLEAKAWEEFWDIWEGYLGTITTVDDATKNAWKEVGKKFAEEAHKHAAVIGLPH